MSKKDEIQIINEVETCGDCFMCIDDHKVCIHPHNPQNNIDLLALPQDCPLLNNPLLICIKDHEGERLH
jgi:hypothetical protein